jgi:HD-like signal output (HDOD) protein/prolyl-tRNA editing enzyme YbaK/EbsC (Cys-tRNA(Pro) deacylase)
VPIAAKLSQFINRKGILCQPVHHPRAQDFAQAIEQANAVPELCAKCVALIDRNGPVVAVIPFLADLNLTVLNQTLGRNFQTLSKEMTNKLFSDCDSGAFPALAMAYGLPVIIDIDMLENETVFSASGCSSTLLKIPGTAFRLAMRGAVKGRISIWPEPLEKLPAPQSENAVPTTMDGVMRKLQRLHQLPPMPETAVRIMHLTSDPESDVFQLAELIERDPSLAAQVMRYARSALFAYRGELSSVKDAVNIVLGFDRVAQLAMGISAAKAFNIPQEGPFGLTRFWQHALYNGVLSQALALLANPDLLIDDKQAYLSGLLHNFGLLLLGHLFPPEFKMLNRLRESNQDASMEEIESQVFGMGSAQDLMSIGHSAIGASLLKMWGLPEASIMVASKHTQANYSGAHEYYVSIIQLSNYYLAQHGVGDEPITYDPIPLLEKLGIQAEQAQQLMDACVEQCHSLDAMIANMAA